MSKCSSLVPFKIMNRAEFQSGNNLYNFITHSWFCYQLVRPSGKRVSKAFKKYAEHVILLYLQNSLAESSSISLNTSALPNLHANVKGVNPALFTIPLLAGSLGCLNAYPNMSLNRKIIHKIICTFKSEKYQFIADHHHM
jgi:hypothetical protein